MLYELDWSKITYTVMSRGLSFLTALRLGFELHEPARPRLSSSYDYHRYYMFSHNTERTHLWEETDLS